MRIEFYLTGHEIQQLREIMDNAPLNPYAPVIIKVLAALPLSGNDIATFPPAGTAPASTTPSAGRGFSEVDALVEHERKRSHNMEQFDRTLREGLQQLRAGNPRFDEEWSV